MLAHYFKNSFKYIGFGAKGKQVRDLLYIDDFCGLIDLQVKNLNKLSSNTYNVGGSKKVSLSLLETTAFCRKVSGNKIKIDKEFCNRPGDIAVYLTDNKKVNLELKWQPQNSPITVLNDIFIWIHNNEKKA